MFLSGGKKEVKKEKNKVSIYLKNTLDSPSAYYCITQYIKRISRFNGKVNGLWPNFLFRLFMKHIFRHGIGNVLRKGVLFCVQIIHIIIYMLRDIYFYKPNVIIICREIFPQKMPGCF